MYYDFLYKLFGYRMLKSMESPSQGLNQLTDHENISMEANFLELTPKKNTGRVEKGEVCDLRMQFLMFMCSFSCLVSITYKFAI